METQDAQGEHTDLQAGLELLILEMQGNNANQFTSMVKEAQAPKVSLIPEKREMQHKLPKK